MSESDGIEEAFEGTARVALTAAGQLGEQLARIREEQLGRARVRSEQEGRQYALWLHTERDTARAQLAPVRNDQWWKSASPQDVVQAYTTARSWEHVDSQAAQAAARIRTEARERYGVDLDSAPLDSAAMDAAFARGQALERQATAERQLKREDLAQAQALIAQADHADRGAEETRRDRLLTAVGLHQRVAEPVGDQGIDTVEERAPEATQARADAAAAYDSAERRAAFAADLEAKGLDRELVATRMRADISQAKPATQAAGRSQVPTGQSRPGARPNRAAKRGRGAR